jgi:hypothetical protein
MFRTIRIFALALAVVAILAACSGTAATPGVATLDDPEASGSPGASPSASADPQEAFLAYAACMRENGVDMQDPQVVQDDAGGGGEFSVGIGPGTGTSKDDFRKADEACRHLIANVVQDKGGPAISAEDQDKLIAFSRCMRDHGIDMPDPDFSGGSAIIKGEEGDGSGSRIDFNSDEFKAAEDACKGLLPGGGVKGGGPSTNEDGGTGPGGVTVKP